MVKYSVHNYVPNQVLRILKQKFKKQHFIFIRNIHGKFDIVSILDRCVDNLNKHLQY